MLFRPDRGFTHINGWVGNQEVIANARTGGVPGENDVTRLLVLDARSRALAPPGELKVEQAMFHASPDGRIVALDHSSDHKAISSSSTATASRTPSRDWAQASDSQVGCPTALGS